MSPKELPAEELVISIMVPRRELIKTALRLGRDYPNAEVIQKYRDPSYVHTFLERIRDYAFKRWMTRMDIADLCVAAGWRPDGEPRERMRRVFTSLGKNPPNWLHVKGHKKGRKYCLGPLPDKAVNQAVIAEIGRNRRAADKVAIAEIGKRRRGEE